jgi:hypothetical protein
MIDKLLCAIFGHRYILERKLNDGARKVGCTRCRNHWAMHDGTRTFVQWNGDFEAFYALGEALPEANAILCSADEIDRLRNIEEAAKQIMADYQENTFSHERMMNLIEALRVPNAEIRG